MASGEDREVPRHLHCPECGASEKMLVHHFEGYYECLRCDNEWYPKPRFSIKEEGAPYLGKRIRAFLDLLRPATMLPAGIAGACLVWLGSILAGSSFSLSLAFGVGILLGLLQAGGQVLNQSSRLEVKIDRENQKVYRPIPQGIIGVDEGKLFGSAILSGAVGFSFAISFKFGLLALIISLFGVFYTYGPSFKYKFLANNFWQGWSRGFIPFLIPYTLFRIDSFIPLGLAFIGGFLVSCIQTVKDVPDLQGDKAYNVPTLPACLGIEGSKKVMTIIATLAFGALLSLVLMNVLSISFAVLFVLMIPVGWLIWSLDNPIQYKYIENSLNWGVMYGVIGALYILSPLILLVG